MTTYVDNTTNVTLDGCTRQKKVDLVVVVSVSTQVLYTAKARLPVRHCCIQVVLLAVRINAETLCRLISGESS